MLLKNYNRNWEVVLKKKRANNFAGNIKLSRWKQTYYSFPSDQNPILLSGGRKKVEQSLQFGLYRTIQ